MASKHVTVTEWGMNIVTHDCWNCKYGLGGGLCMLNLEGECAAGDEPVAWEAKEEEQDER